MRHPTVERVEQRLKGYSYPERCSWKHLSYRNKVTTQGATSWWALTIAPGKLYVLVRFSSYGQIAMTLGTQAVLPPERCFLHYVKFDQDFVDVVHSLASKDWPSLVEAMHVTLSSKILQEWIAVLDKAEGGKTFESAHNSYVQQKEREAMLRSVDLNKPKHKRKPRKEEPPKKKKQQMEYAKLDFGKLQ